MNDFKPNVIINAAAYTAVDKAELEDYLAFSVNSEGPKFLAKASGKNNSVLIHLSTDYVFSGDKEGEYTEYDTVCPGGVYGRTKLEGGECGKKVLRKIYNSANFMGFWRAW